MALIEALNIKKYFPTQGGRLVKAVDDVSFSIESGETVGMVGESGCGKSTIGRVILNLIAPSDGQLMFEDRNIFELPRAERRALRRKMGIVFQDPYSSLNPRMNVLQIVGEPLIVHHKLKGADSGKRSFICWSRSGSNPSRSTVTRTSFRGGSGSGWGLHGHWRWVRNF